MAIVVVNAVAGGAAARACEVWEDEVFAGLSAHTVEIHTRFVGTTLAVYGVTACPGDVIVTIRGPQKRATVRQKVRIAGLWLIGRDKIFEAVHTFYAVASTAPLEEILPQLVRERHFVGLESLAPRLEEPSAVAEDLNGFGEALIRHQQHRQLYPVEALSVDSKEGGLFWAPFRLPKSIQSGEYRVDVYYVQDSTIVGTVILPFSVDQVGFQATVARFAHERPALYGLATVVAVMISGWLIGIVFRKH